MEIPDICSPFMDHLTNISPFKLVAIAISFSGRLEEMLADSRNIANGLGAKMILVHVGKFSEEKEKKLNNLLVKLNFKSGNYRVVWEEGDPVDALLKVCDKNCVDLLIAGAMERENMIRYVVGSVSREICRKAKTSVLMITNPETNPKHFRKIVVSGDEHPMTSMTIDTAAFWGRQLGGEEFHVVVEKEIMAVGDKKKKKQVVDDKKVEELIQHDKEILSHVDTGTMKVKTRKKSGKPGIAISSYVKTIGADLLVLHAVENNLNIMDRIFTHDIEYIFAEMPCNLLIINSQLTNAGTKTSN